jgi:copper chaperone CopZ
MLRTLTILLLLLGLLSPAWGATAANRAATVALTVRGMFCGSCANTVKKALAPLPGIMAVQVDVKKDLVTVTYDRQKGSVPQMVQAIRRAGYQAGELRTP